MAKKSGLPPYVIKKTRRPTDGTVRYFYYFQRGTFRVSMPPPDAADFTERYENIVANFKESPDYFQSWGGEDPIMNNNVLDGYFSRREATAKKRAQMAGREYTLPKYWGADQYMLQKGRCALTGAVMRKATGLMDPFCPTIDRIDSSKGYTPENSQLVTLQVNLAKNNMSEDDFIKMCRSVVSHGKGRMVNRP